MKAMNKNLKVSLCLVLALGMVHVAKAQTQAEEQPQVDSYLALQKMKEERDRQPHSTGATAVLDSVIAGVGCPVSIVATPVVGVAASGAGIFLGISEALLNTGSKDRFEMTKHYYKNDVPYYVKGTANVLCINHLKAISPRVEKKLEVRDANGKNQASESDGSILAPAM